MKDATGDEDPRNWTIDAPQEAIDLYLALSSESRPLTEHEAQLMVQLVDAWRAHEHRKHIALMHAKGV